MRNLLPVFLILLLTIFVGCSKEESTIIVVENVEVQLNTKSVFNIEQEGFSTRSTTTEYQHVYPTKFKAYFIAAESKGPYTKEQLVATIDVKEGMQTITVPKLKYTVYVTNFEHTSEGWYTWNKPLDQMPLASDVLYLFGSNVIDYSTAIYGEVTARNPWSAIMIENYEYFAPNIAPLEYTSTSNYVLTADEGWWLKYVRNKHNTVVWLKYPWMTGNTQLELQLDVLPNKVYKYRMTTPETSDKGNFEVITETFNETIEVDWELW